MAMSTVNYSAYGAPAGGSGEAATNPGFNGQEQAGGLVYMRNRWYDPNTGRFTQQDPIGYGGGINLYAYAGNDPVSYSDPFGLNPCLVPPTAQLCVAAVATAVVVLAELARQTLNHMPLDGTLGIPKLPNWFGNQDADEAKLPTSVDETGKVHGPIPDFVPGSATTNDLKEAADALITSIRTRGEEQRRLGEHGPHRERMRQEERLLRKITKKLSGS